MLSVMWDGYGADMGRTWNGYGTDIKETRENQMGIK